MKGIVNIAKLTDPRSTAVLLAPRLAVMGHCPPAFDQSLALVGDCLMRGWILSTMMISDHFRVVIRDETLAMRHVLPASFIIATEGL